VVGTGVIVGAAVGVGVGSGDGIGVGMYVGSGRQKHESSHLPARKQVGQYKVSQRVGSPPK
jgi:hypothetical protein